MVFDPKKFTDIFQEMRRRTAVLTDFEEGSVVRTMYESFAYEIALLYEKMNLVYLSAYVDTAEGQQLDQVVSVLGITRGLPDFAQGSVTFERDVGNNDIDIPLATLVATEDTAENPKKVFQTIEAKILAKDRTSVEVKVQAVNRGEEQATPAETVVVMPRPLPGIKGVVNSEPIRFTGKRRESDEELRERAKNALISAGKATIVSIENALLSLPGVKDVQVKEHFHFARGEVNVSGPLGTIIDKGTRLIADMGDIKKSFITLEQVELGTAPETVEIQSLLEGKGGEIADPSAIAEWIVDDPDLSGIAISSAGLIILKDFGIIEVFVDGPDLSEPGQKARIQAEVDRVRAAGIFVLLKSASKVNLDGVFKIEINPGLSFNEEERAEFENTVRVEIINFISGLKLGETLAFSKLIKNLLSLDGIENLADFRIMTPKKEVPVSFSDREISVEAFERFNPRYICVASEEKLLPVNLQFKLEYTGSGDPDWNGIRGAIITALSAYFDNELEDPPEVSRNKIIAKIEGAAADVVVATEPPLLLLPQPWCQRPLVEEDISKNDEIIKVSFVETAVLGEVFAYHSFLEITGALKLTLPIDIKDEDKAEVRKKVGESLQAFLIELPSETDLVFDELTARAMQVELVLAVDLEVDDFRVTLNGDSLSDRITAEMIAIEQFEKARWQFFCISGDIETVEIKPAEAIEVTTVDPKPSSKTITEIRTAIVNAFNNHLTDPQAGNVFSYNALRNALENLLPDAPYNITKLTLQGDSLCDGRRQTVTITAPQDIHIRSVEIASLLPITDSNVEVKGKGA